MKYSASKFSADVLETYLDLPVSLGSFETSEYAAIVKDAMEDIKSIRASVNTHLAKSISAGAKTKALREALEALGKKVMTQKDKLLSAFKAKKAKILKEFAEKMDKWKGQVGEAAKAARKKIRDWKNKLLMSNQEYLAHGRRQIQQEHKRTQNKLMRQIEQLAGA